VAEKDEKALKKARTRELLEPMTSPGRPTNGRYTPTISKVRLTDANSAPAVSGY
jgi:hypothetical protein